MAQVKQEADGTFELTEREQAEFLQLEADRKFIESEQRNLDIRLDHLFLQIQMRTGIDVAGWSANTKTGLCGPTPESVAPKHETRTEVMQNRQAGSLNPSLVPVED